MLIFFSEADLKPMKENALVIGKIYKDIKKDNNVWKRGDMKGRREERGRE
jgi:hypothetical protein